MLQSRTDDRAQALPFGHAHEAVHVAASLIRSARYRTAFTGAGISVESGIPPCRGRADCGASYDPRMLELGSIQAHPEKSWPILREIFYDGRGHLRCFITQNIDSVQ
jgi:NAD-dependent deacetylase